MWHFERKGLWQNNKEIISFWSILVPFQVCSEMVKGIRQKTFMLQFHNLYHNVIIKSVFLRKQFTIFYYIQNWKQTIAGYGSFFLESSERLVKTREKVVIDWTNRVTLKRSSDAWFSHFVVQRTMGNLQETWGIWKNQCCPLTFCHLSKDMQSNVNISAKQICNVLFSEKAESLILNRLD